ncbi:polyketide synthase dehydratase domain-containing protein, partial [Streptomyces avermitilis]|uniref:polyketide synthase dehydratase domain-containing protein n=1 Tax=Streptomyces avermitilis TaxID=33903 RepID=UPI0033D63C7B
MRFADGVATVLARGVDRFLELGPRGALTAMAEETLDHTGIDAVCVPVLHPERPEEASLLHALAAASVAGAAVDWTTPFAGARTVELPTYAFQRRRFWPRPAASAGVGDLAAAGLAEAGHPLLTAWLPSPEGDGVLCTGRVSLATHPWLGDHTVLGTVLVPGTAFVDLVGWVGDRVGCGGIRELTLATPLALAENAAVRLRVVLGAPDDTGCRPVAVYAQPDTKDEGTDWTRHAEGLLAPAGASETPAAPSGPGFDVWPVPGAEPLPMDGFYEGLADAGFAYGPLFRGLRAAWRRGDEVFAEVSLPADESGAGFGVHPALLDAALHALGPAAQASDEPGSARLPFSWGEVRVHAVGADLLRVRLVRAADGTVTLDAADAAGRPVVSIGSLVLRPLSPDRLRADAHAPDDALFATRWVPLDATGATGDTARDTVECVLLGEPVGGAWRSHPDVAAYAAALADGKETPGPVLAHCPSATGDPAEAAQRSAEWTLDLLQQWLADDRLTDSHLVIGTRHAAPVDATDAAPVDATDAAPVDATDAAPVDATDAAPVDATDAA